MRSVGRATVRSHDYSWYAITTISYLKCQVPWYSVHCSNYSASKEQHCAFYRVCLREPYTYRANSLPNHSMKRLTVDHFLGRRCTLPYAGQYHPYRFLEDARSETTIESPNVATIRPKKFSMAQEVHQACWRLTSCLKAWTVRLSGTTKIISTYPNGQTTRELNEVFHWGGHLS